jgi:phage-related protein
MTTIPITTNNFRIIYEDGSEVDMARNLSVLVRSFTISAPDPMIYHEQLAGRSGLIRMGKDYGGRRINAVCELYALDNTDYPFLRNEIFRVLFHEMEFYVVSEAEPHKRWRVEVDSSFSPERVGSMGAFTIPFICSEPYAESIGTTLDLFTFDSETWQVGQGLDTDMTMTNEKTTTWFDIGHKKWGEL